jgi:hypothetical protein
LNHQAHQAARVFPSGHKHVEMLFVWPAKAQRRKKESLPRRRRSSNVQQALRAEEFDLLGGFASLRAKRDSANTRA